MPFHLLKGEGERRQLLGNLPCSSLTRRQTLHVPHSPFRQTPPHKYLANGCILGGWGGFFFFSLLAALQENLAATQNILKEILLEHSEANASTLGAVKDLAEVSRLLDVELPRYM